MITAQIDSACVVGGKLKHITHISRWPQVSAVECAHHVVQVSACAVLHSGISSWSAPVMAKVSVSFNGSNSGGM